VISALSAAGVEKIALFTLPDLAILRPLWFGCHEVQRDLFSSREYKGQLSKLKKDKSEYC
jgi:hypothetical protein